MNLALVTPARRFIANRYGLGYQLPLGLVLLGGPLVDAGHDVRLVDNDAYGWNHDRLARELRGADAVLLGHTGSTAAHTTCLETARALKVRLPGLRIAYGGVFPTYHARESLEQCDAVDAVVRGEGEQTALELVDAWARGDEADGVAGVVWRDGGEIRFNRPRPPIRDLDAYRPGWELVDWPRYRLFGCGRSAGVQFSRGCPLTCGYCGQWQFWRRWRHRSPADFVAQLRLLAERYDVKIAWLADENFAADRDAACDVVERLAAAELGVSLNLNMTAADVVRDRDLLPLYKRAGVDYVVMGIEALDDEVVASIGKDNPFALSLEAVRALRANGIVSLVNVIYGLEDESLRTCLAKLRALYRLDPDIANCVYLTPHSWTRDGRATDAAAVIEGNQARWTYRNQVLRTPHLSPAQLFALVKLTEGTFHLRPRALARLVRGDDARVRRIRRASLAVGGRVVAAEIAEFASTRRRL